MKHMPDDANRPARKAENDFTLSEREHWFVVRSLPRQEAKAEYNLRHQGFRTFLPRIPKTTRHARKLRHVLAPLFPGYMFVIIAPDRDRWRAINSTIGVASMIMACERPLPVPGGVVDRIIECVCQDGILRGYDELVEGQRVRLLSGPFAEMIGNLERLDPNGRVKVLLDIMGGAVPAYVDRAALEAV